jgi:hypothetical protein
MIGQEVNSPAQKLLRSARRKRDTAQGAGVLVSCSHVVSSQTGEVGRRLFQDGRPTARGAPPEWNG